MYNITHDQMELYITTIYIVAICVKLIILLFSVIEMKFFILLYNNTAYQYMLHYGECVI